METTNTPPRVLTRMPRRIPVNGTFELTVRCNLHCKMCMFRHDDRENPELMAKELTAAQWIDMARQAAEAGTMNLLITGGEPLLRPDFCEIWEGIYRQGFVTTLYTNATLEEAAAARAEAEDKLFGDFLQWYAQAHSAGEPASSHQPSHNTQ